MLSTSKHAQRSIKNRRLTTIHNIFRFSRARGNIRAALFTVTNITPIQTQYKFCRLYPPTQRYICTVQNDKRNTERPWRVRENCESFMLIAISTLNKYAVMANTQFFVQPRTKPTAVDFMDTFTCAMRRSLRSLIRSPTLTLLTILLAARHSFNSDCAWQCDEWINVASCFDSNGNEHFVLTDSSCTNLSCSHGMTIGCFATGK